MSRENLEKQFEIQYKDKSPEEIMEIGRQIAMESINKEKEDAKNKMAAMRAIFNACNSLKSNRFK